MIRSWRFAAVVALVLPTVAAAQETAPAKIDVAKAQQTATQVCAACHGPDANSASDTSTSVVTLTVWDNCDPHFPIAAGVQQYPAAGMVQLFLETPDNNGNIVAHLVGFADCDTNGTGTGPGGIPVRLVNTAQ